MTLIRRALTWRAYRFWARMAGQPAGVRVVATETTEQPAAALDERWYEVYAFRIGDPADRQVAVLFNDIKARKRSEKACETLTGNCRRRQKSYSARTEIWSSLPVWPHMICERRSGLAFSFHSFWNVD